MAKYPGWDEEVILETWPQLPKRYGFERDYLMRDLQGEVIARAVSEWVIIDIATRKLKRADTIAIDSPPIVIDRALDCVLGKINPPEEQRLIYKHTVGCSEIDLNGHLNNAKYIDYIMDCFTKVEITDNQARSIQVNYLGEAFPGDTLAMYLAADPQEPQQIYVEGLNEQDNRQIFVARLHIQPVKE
jgi:acyl-ACP thioesterase